jgi:hypothetical protein
MILHVATFLFAAAPWRAPWRAFLPYFLARQGSYNVVAPKALGPSGVAKSGGCFDGGGRRAPIYIIHKQQPRPRYISPRAYHQAATNSSRNRRSASFPSPPSTFSVPTPRGRRSSTPRPTVKMVQAMPQIDYIFALGMIFAFLVIDSYFSISGHIF